MKILQVSPHYVPAYGFGGVLRAVHDLSRELVRQGHDVRVVTTNLRSRREKLSLEHSGPHEVDGLEVFYEPVTLSRYWGFSPALARRIWQQLDWADVVLLHFHFQFASWIGALLCRWCCKPYVVFSHGSLNAYSVEARSKWKKRVYLQFLERRNFLKAAFVAYQSREEYEASLHPGQKHRIVPNGVTLGDMQTDVGSKTEEYENSCWNFLPGDPVYLYLGRFSSGKGLLMLVNAFASVVTSFPAAKLVLAGEKEGGCYRELMVTIDALGIAPSVIFSGFVEGMEKLSLLKRADVFVLPSRSEGMSMALLEAMAAGLPVVVTDRVGLSGTIAERRCGMVTNYTVESLEDALLNMAGRSIRERKAMGEAGCRTVTNEFSWQKIAGDLVESLRQHVR